MNLNISKVAKKCGVSTATVSRVINNPSKVNEKTRKKVERVINELGYVPNQQARSLRNQKTRMIGVIIPHKTDYLFEYPYFSIFLKECSKRLRQDNYHLILTTDENESNSTETYQMFLNKRIVDGFIVMDVIEDDRRVEFLKQKKAKFVVIGRITNSNNIVYIDTNNEHGAYIATKHLLKISGPNILFINGPKEHSVSKWRFKGYKKALNDLGLDVNKNLVTIGDFKEETGERITKEKVSNIDIDGIFATSDLMAVGAMKALKQMKVNKPVIGFDDIPLASSFQPSLTTIRQPIEKVGYQAAEKIVKLIDTGSAESAVLDVELLVRDSTRFYNEDS